jgi:dolichyl-phosphate beta-glucosyltransferase
MINTENKTVFIIPCYNEAERIDLNEYSQSLSRKKEINLHFIDDGSSDNTSEVLTQIKSKFPERIKISILDKNRGKAEAVRYGIMNSIQTDKDIKYLGYLDADLATSLDEGYELAQTLHQKDELDMVFGSRVLLVGTVISRNKFRHFTGRIVATTVSNILRLKVYDSQCGAKFFSRQLATLVFEHSFISKWLFDVEIFARILSNHNQFSEKNMLEVPLKSWIDKEGSKVKMSYFFKLFLDLLKIKKSYPKLTTRSN